MTKKECLKILNEVLQFLPELDCFEDICDHLEIDDSDLELVLSSKVTNLVNDELE